MTLLVMFSDNTNAKFTFESETKPTNQDILDNVIEVFNECFYKEIVNYVVTTHIV